MIRQKEKVWIIRREADAPSEGGGTDRWSDRVETVRKRGSQGSQTEEAKVMLRQGGFKDMTTWSGRQHLGLTHVTLYSGHRFAGPCSSCSSQTRPSAGHGMWL